jgi:hypothetical protein
MHFAGRRVMTLEPVRHGASIGRPSTWSISMGGSHGRLVVETGGRVEVHEVAGPERNRSGRRRTRWWTYGPSTPADQPRGEAPYDVEHAGSQRLRHWGQFDGDRLLVEGTRPQLPVVGHEEMAGDAVAERVGDPLLRFAGGAAREVAACRAAPSKQSATTSTGRPNRFDWNG